MCVCVCVCARARVCVCVCVCERERGTDRQMTSDSLFACRNLLQLHLHLLVHQHTGSFSHSYRQRLRHWQPISQCINFRKGKASVWGGMNGGGASYRPNDKDEFSFRLYDEA